MVIYDTFRFSKLSSFLRIKKKRSRIKLSWVKIVAGYYYYLLGYIRIMFSLFKFVHSESFELNHEKICFDVIALYLRLKCSIEHTNKLTLYYQFISNFVFLCFQQEIVLLPKTLLSTIQMTSY